MTSKGFSNPKSVARAPLVPQPPDPQPLFERQQIKRKSIKMTLFSHPKIPKSSKYVSFINKIEPPEFAQLEPSRKAPETRFVGVAERLQNKRKSIKMIIYSHHKQPKS